MVRDDSQFQNPAIFVAGYEASLGAGLYDVRAAADEILANLRTPTEPPAPLAKDRIVFVCHSQGGIVVRQMLCAHFEDFKEKHIGVVLCGSPSWGSFYAKFLAPLILLLRFRQASALSWGSSTLRNLDRDFLELLERKRIPHLNGLCLAESKGRLLGIPIPKFVAEPSATRYFKWQPIAKATHGSLVKPPDKTYGSHVLLRDFAHTKRFLSRSDFKGSLSSVLSDMENVLNVYRSDRSETQQRKASCLESLFQHTRNALEKVDREDRFIGVAVEKIIQAQLSASDSWAFHDLSREEFVGIRDSLRTVLRQLE